MERGDQPKLKDVPVPEFILAVAGTMAARAAVCLGPESPDLRGARLCIDSLRAVAAAARDRLGDEPGRELDALVGDLQLAYARAAAGPGKESS